LCKVKPRMNKTGLQSVRQRIKILPSFPLVAKKILQVINDPRSQVAELASVISKDQSLSAKVLRLVNSAFYSLPRQITTLSEAVVILGFHTIKNLSLGLSLFTLLDAKKKGEFDRFELWKHCLGCASCSRLIAVKVGSVLPEETFVAGLLHDIGKFILDEYLNEDFSQALKVARERNLTLIEAEQRTFEVDHTIVGEWLACDWKLPEVFRYSIRYHHKLPTPDQIPEKSCEHYLKVLTIVLVANVFCKIRNIGSGGDSYIQPIKNEVWRILNLSQEDALRVLSELDEEVKKTYAFFEIEQEIPQSIQDSSILRSADLPDDRTISILKKEGQLIDVISVALESVGYRTKINLINEPDLIEELKAYEPSLIISVMPLGDLVGNEQFQIFFQENKGGIPIIVIDSEKVTEEKKRISHSLRVEYLSLPFELRGLVECIKRLTEKSKIETP
jgi:putative nucleotidyltransferase with HDIG domain